ncbi:matrix metalloproteinase-23-like [Nematolebias whitei]|uniref:matrix metalloproteinase-23-like n=1 Tax=Nematolebias whitei TaxID=451745 RepID=UPI0018981BBD|nr:matrix metalloproteinase-23-like [Nematolebias whitei]
MFHINTAHLDRGPWGGLAWGPGSRGVRGPPGAHGGPRTPELRLFSSCLKAALLGSGSETVKLHLSGVNGHRARTHLTPPTPDTPTGAVNAPSGLVMKLLLLLLLVMKMMMKSSAQLSNPESVHLHLRILKFPNTLNAEDTRKAISIAFAKWSDVSPLSFTEVTDSNTTTDITIGFYTFNHTDWCLDKKRVCDPWARLGFCERRKAFMKKNCPRRCDLCYEPLEVVATPTPSSANIKVKMVPRGKVVGFRCGTKSLRSPPKVRV